MSEAKPFASLSSGLLARKGAAKPAMRRPNINVNPAHVAENGQDDLGWNDMGYDVDPDLSQEAQEQKPRSNPLANAVVTPKPEVKQQQERIAAQLQTTIEEDLSEDTKSNDIDIAEPIALHDKVDKIQPSDEMPSDLVEETQLVPVSPILVKKSKSEIQNKAMVVKKPVSKSNSKGIKAVKAKAKAAFTLRLDPERHLKLRLACAINNISAQKFVTDALDQKLNEMEQINQLSGQIAGSK